MSKSLKDYFKEAYKNKWAIGQYNFSDFSQMKAIVAAAEEASAPVILGTSEGESKFFGLEEAVALRNVLRKKSGLPVFLNLDHGKSFEYIKRAIDAGYDMVHFDGSKLLLEENIKITKEVIKYAKKKKVLVEGEVGRMGTDSSKIYMEKFQIKEEDLTSPEQAREYLDKTKTDLLAVSIGTFHGIEISGICPNLRLDLLRRITEKTPGIPLVLHGGSGTPQKDIKEAINNGVAKININTEIRLAFSGNLRKALNENVEEIVPYKFLEEPKMAAKKLVALKIELFGTAGRS